MKRAIAVMFTVVVLFLAAGIAAAQTAQGTSDSNQISRSTKAVGYQVGGGSTTIDLLGTDLMSQARGEANVEAKTGVTTVEVKVKGMSPASKLGTELLTYVLWAVSPDGRTSNIGEIQINQNNIIVVE